MRVIVTNRARNDLLKLFDYNSIPLFNKRILKIKNI